MATHIYYSVRPAGAGSGNNLRTGTPTMTIAAGVATLNTAQTGNVGVGMEIDYDGTTKKCYISVVNSSTSFDVVTATGGTPSAEASPVAVDSIHAVWASISAFEAAFTGANFINNLDLTLATGADVIAHCACYKDTADTTSCVWSGATTATGNYIRVFTPRGLSENESILDNRHQGKWDTAYFSHEIASSWCHRLLGSVSHTRFEGLQLSCGSHAPGPWLEGVVDDLRISHCVMKGDATTANADCLRLDSINGGGVVRVSNCTIFDYSGSGGLGLLINDSDLTLYMHHVTIVACSVGIRRIAGSENIKNCIVDCPNCFLGTATAAQNDYNYATDNDGADGDWVGGNGNNNATIGYVAAGSDDYHLASGDPVDGGDDLTGDANLPVTDDIDGDTRIGHTPDAGSDEIPEAVGAIMNQLQGPNLGADLFNGTLL